MTIKDVACHLGVSWDVVKEIQKKYLHRRFAKPKLKHVKQIAIDEISTGKGHQYVTIVMDLESGAVLHVGQGKGGDALTPFWRRLRASHAKIEAVATDMSPAYIDAVTTYLPDATLGLRSLSRHQALQRQAFRSASGFVPPTGRHDAKRRAQRRPLAAVETPFPHNCCSISRNYRNASQAGVFDCWVSWSGGKCPSQGSRLPEWDLGRTTLT